MRVLQKTCKEDGLLGQGVLSQIRESFMSRRKKKKKGIIPVVILGFLLGICIVVVIGFASGSLTGTDEQTMTQKVSKTVKKAVTKKVSETVMEQAVKQALESTGEPEATEKAKEIVDNMDEGDKEKAQRVRDGGDGDSISEVKEYLRENVSEQDQAELEELYRKYSEEYLNMLN